MKLFHVAGLVLAVSLAALGSASAQYAPWPPPPGMSAGEYAARYGHLVDPDRPYGRRGWEQDRRRDWRREQWRQRHDDDYDDDE